MERVLQILIEVIGKGGKELQLTEKQVAALTKALVAYQRQLARTKASGNEAAESTVAMRKAQQLLKEMLDRTSAAADKAAKKVAELKAADDKSAESTNKIARAEQRYQSLLNQKVRLETEVLRVEQQRIRTGAQFTRMAQQITAAQVQAAMAEARAAAAAGQHAKALQILQQTMRTLNLTHLQRLSIEKQMTQTSMAQAAALERKQRAEQRAAAAAFALAMAEARLAKAQGDSAKQMTLLTALKNRANLTDSQRIKVLTALAAAERAAAREAMAGAAGAAGGRGVFSGLMWGGVRILSTGVLLGFLARSIFRTLDRFVLEPLRDIVRLTVEGTEEFRRMEASLTGIVGTMRAAKEITADALAASKGLPITGAEALLAAQRLAFIPATAGALQTPGPQRVEQLHGLQRILTGLATIDPEQGIRGAAFALREALAGEFRSLRFRFEISPDVVAATIGKDLADLKQDPRLTIQALERFVDLFVGDAALQEFDKLLSTQGNKLRGAIQEFFNLVGGSGFYDSLVGRVRGLQELITSGVRGDNPALAGVAAALSKTLERIVDGMLRSISSGVSVLLGRDIDLSAMLRAEDLQSLGNVVVDVTEKLGTFAIAITKLASEMAAHAIRISMFLVDEFQGTTGRVQGPIQGVIGGVASGSFTDEDVFNKSREIREELNREDQVLRAELIEARGQLAALQDKSRFGRLMSMFAGHGNIGGLQKRVDQLYKMRADIANELKLLDIVEPDLYEKIIDRQISGPTALGASDSLKEALTALMGVGSRISNTAVEMGEIESPQTIEGHMRALLDAVDLFFSETDPGSLPSVLARTSAALDEARREMAQRPTDELQAQIDDLLDQQEKQLAGVDQAFTKMLLRKIQGLPAVFGEMAPGPRGGSAEQFLNSLLQQMGGTAVGATGGIFAGVPSGPFGALSDPSRLPIVMAAAQEAIRQVHDDIIFFDQDVEKATSHAIKYIDAWVQIAEQSGTPEAAAHLRAMRIEFERMRATAIESRFVEDFKRSIELSSEAAQRLIKDIDRVMDRISEAQSADQRLMAGVPRAGDGGGFFQNILAFQSNAGTLAANRAASIEQINQAIAELTGELVRQATIIPTNVKAIENLHEAIAKLRTEAEKLRRESGDENAFFRGIVGQGVPGFFGPGATIRGAGRLVDFMRQGAAEGRRLELDDAPAFISLLDSFAEAINTLEVTGGAEQIDRFRQSLLDLVPALFEAEEAQQVVIEVLEAWKQKAEEWAGIWEQSAERIDQAFKQSLGDAIVGVVMGEENAIENAARSFVQTFTRAIVDAAIEDLFQNMIGDFFKGFFKSFAGSGTTTGAQGLAIGSGRVVPFASGGIVTGPTFFGMSGPRRGLMGEAGPEAVMPLVRTPQGDLGVKTSGAGGSVTNVVVNVHGVTDVDGFRRSKDQIARSMRGALERSSG